MTPALELIYTPPRNGETLILTCLLSPHFVSNGSKYTWRKNSEILPADRKAVVYSTEVTSQLHIPRASAKLDSGRYECGVQNLQDSFTVSTFVYFKGRTSVTPSSKFYRLASHRSGFSCRVVELGSTLMWYSMS